MTDAEIVELAIRRAVQGHDTMVSYWLIKAADEIAKLVAERSRRDAGGLTDG